MGLKGLSIAVVWCTKSVETFDFARLSLHLSVIYLIKHCSTSVMNRQTSSCLYGILNSTMCLNKSLTISVELNDFLQ